MVVFFCYEPVSHIDNSYNLSHNSNAYFGWDVGMMIARVFPNKTSMCPVDQDAYFGLPQLFMPRYDEIHISVTFTWDIPKAYQLVKEWNNYGRVKVGGVALDGESKKPFIPGIYLKKGITITSRGCPNNCSFCLIKNPLIEFDEFPEGNIIQDNNILACSNHHLSLVFKMLRNQKAIEFKGGLEKYRITPKIAEELRSLSVKTMWLACDPPYDINSLKNAVTILRKVGFTINHIYCYVLIGKDINKETHILNEILKCGCMPFAQLLKDKDDSIIYSKKWKRFQREWSRPAIIRSKLK